MARVAVIVPTYQRAARLPFIIAALEEQTFPREDVEVVICDDSSTDGSADVLQELAARSPLNIRIMRTERNSGPAVARNIAWRSTQVPILAFFDDDCRPAPNWLASGVAAFDQPDVGVVQGRTIPDPTSAVDASDPVRYRAATQRIYSLSKRYEACNIFYRRKVLEAVGGFDESIYFFGEDTVPGWSARRLGAGDRFAPGALAYHEVARRGVRWYLRWGLLYRHWPMLIRRFPEMRREVLWGRVFLAPRHAALLAAYTGFAIAPFWPPALALAAPALSRYVPGTFKREFWLGGLVWAAFDTLVMASLIAGSVRYRTVIL